MRAMNRPLRILALLIGLVVPGGLLAQASSRDLERGARLLRENSLDAALEHLDCSNNSLGGAGSYQLVDCLLESKVRLKTLNSSLLLA